MLLHLLQKYHGLLLYWYNSISDINSMKQLTNMEYGVLMQAISNAKNEIAEDTFIDPFDNEEKVTNEQALEALNSAEQKIMDSFLSK